MAAGCLSPARRPAHGLSMLHLRPGEVIDALAGETPNHGRQPRLQSRPSAWRYGPFGREHWRYIAW
jgi:hypothetical protein